MEEGVRRTGRQGGGGCEAAARSGPAFCAHRVLRAEAALEGGELCVERVAGRLGGVAGALALELEGVGGGLGGERGAVLLGLEGGLGGAGSFGGSPCGLGGPAALGLEGGGGGRGGVGGDLGAPALGREGGVGGHERGLARPLGSGQVAQRGLALGFEHLGVQLEGLESRLQEHVAVLRHGRS